MGADHLIDTVRRSVPMVCLRGGGGRGNNLTDGDKIMKQKEDQRESAIGTSCGRGETSL